MQTSVWICQTYAVIIPLAVCKCRPRFLSPWLNIQDSRNIVPYSARPGGLEPRQHIGFTHTQRGPESPPPPLFGRTAAKAPWQSSSGIAGTGEVSQLLGGIKIYQELYTTIQSANN